METDEQKRQDEQQRPPAMGPAMPMGMAMWPPAQPAVNTPPAMPSAPSGSPMPPAPSVQQATPMPTLPQPKKSAIAGLQEKAAGVENPFARALAKTGAGILGGMEAVGESAFPGVAMMVPHSILNTAVENRRADKRASEQAAMGQNERKTAAEETTAGAKKSEADTAAKKETFEETHPKTGLTPEEQFMNDALHGGQGGTAKLDAQGQPYTYLTAHGAWKQQEQDAKPPKPDTETQEAQRYEKIKTAQAMKQPVGAEDLAWSQAYEKRKTLAPYAGAAAQAPQKTTERADKSFQFNNTALDKVSGPLDQLNQRMGRLMDSINQNTPQADAFVAPELLSVMSGGAGSGLRMNEAEISRIVGGRSNWESLQAAINKWKTDPKAALSITAEQRQEIRALAKTVQDKLIAKEQIIDDARDALIDSDDPKEHRRVVADAKKKLDAIDSGQAGGGQGRTVKIGGSEISVGQDGTFRYQGHSYKVNPDGKGGTLVK